LKKNSPVFILYVINYFGCRLQVEQQEQLPQSPQQPLPF